MTVLHDNERRDLRQLLSSARHELTYAVTRPGAEDIVARLDFWYEALATDQERTKAEQLRQRLSDLRDR